jgi:hypothetical protein
VERVLPVNHLRDNRTKSFLLTSKGQGGTSQTACEAVPFKLF